MSSGFSKYAESKAGFGSLPPRQQVFDHYGTQMNLLSQLFALEKMFKEEVDRMRFQIDFEVGAVQRGQGNLSKEEQDQVIRLAQPKEVERLREQILAGPAGWGSASLRPPKPEVWNPRVVLNMERHPQLPLAKQPLSDETKELTTFPKSFLFDTFGGTEWSAGLYLANDPKKHGLHLKDMLKSKSYYLLDCEFEPFIPKKAGDHGAKLTVLFRDDDGSVDNTKLYTEVPLFVALDESNPTNYVYLGHYSQTRWSDKLDVDRMYEVVPEKVQKYWAEKLADPQRPKWIEEALVEHWWPMPKYQGTVPTAERSDNASEARTPADVTEMQQEADEDLKDYILELVEWKKTTQERVKEIDYRMVTESFDHADAAEEPGLRFWWEWLEFEYFSRDFYYLLVTALNGGSKEAVNAEGGRTTMST